MNSSMIRSRKYWRMMPPFKRKKEEPWQARLGTTVFDPLECMELQDAIGKKAKKVTIGEKTFLLSYKLEGQVFYKPEKGYAPCGYLNMEHFLGEI